jgi:hypothetical protein
MTNLEEGILERRNSGKKPLKKNVLGILLKYSRTHGNWLRVSEKWSKT